MDERLKKVIKELNRRGFLACAVSTKEEARKMLLQAVEAAQTIGIGGSVSIQQLDIVKTLQGKGKQVYAETGKRRVLHTGRLQGRAAGSITGGISKQDGKNQRFSNLQHDRLRLQML